MIDCGYGQIMENLSEIVIAQRGGEILSMICPTLPRWAVL